MAPARWRSSDAAVSGSKTTGHSVVGTLRAPRRRSVRRAASRPTLAGSSSAARWRLNVYHESRCMLPFRRATGVTERLKLEPLYVPAKPRLEAYATCPPPPPKSAPSELSISGAAVSAAARSEEHTSELQS